MRHYTERTLTENTLIVMGLLLLCIILSTIIVCIFAYFCKQIDDSIKEEFKNRKLDLGKYDSIKRHDPKKES